VRLSGDSGGSDAFHMVNSGNVSVFYVMPYGKYEGEQHFSSIDWSIV